MQCCLLLEDVLDYINSVLKSVSNIREHLEEQKMARLMQSRSGGRPKLSVSPDHIIFYLEHGFCVADIAKMFSCSRRTIERRMKEAGLNSYSSISDDELVSVI